MLIFSILSSMIEVLSDTLQPKDGLKISRQKGERLNGEEGNHKEEVDEQKNHG
jgi:hypothetical protein